MGNAAPHFSAHDLLYLADPSALAGEAPLPPWATPEWLACAPVVVRRDRPATSGLIPVGARGAARHQRYKGHVAREAIVRRLAPEMLAAPGIRERHRAGDVPAIEALCRVAPLLDATGLAWGPTGGVGFTLASGIAVLRADSDLDLLVRAPDGLTDAQSTALGMLASACPCRIDIQIDTGLGGFAFAEWARGSGQVLLKTAAGPILTNNPWQGGWA